jgi:Tfp pilus assembly protein PilX
MPTGNRQQRGIVLIVCLIMLVMMTLLIVAAYNLGKSNLQSVGNMQSHNEAVAVAKSAIEEVLSTTNFATNPSVSFGTGNTKSYTVNGVANAVTVTLTPQPCIKKFKVLAADPSDAGAQGCLASVQQNFGVQDASTGGSSCVDVLWEVTAEATEAVTDAKATVVQGISIRQDAATAANTANYCL